MVERRVSVKFSAEIQNFKAATESMAQSTEKVKKASEDAGKASDAASKVAAEAAKRHADALDRVGAAATVGGAAILAGVGLAVKSYADFDKQMSSVDAATHETAGNMALLRQAAIDAGADTAFSAVEAAKGIEEMAKAGVSTKDILAGGLKGALSLAAAGSLDVGKAAEIAASAMTQFKLKGDQLPHVADLLAAGAGKAQGSVEDLGAALNQSGLVAAQTGLTIEETTGGLAAFAAAGLTGSDAGTSFKTMLGALTPNSKEAAKAMEELGISAYDSQGNFIGLSEFAGQLRGSLSGLTVEQRNATLETIFGSDAVRAASVLYENGAAGVEKWEAAVNDAGYAADTAARMQDNLAGDLEKLGGSFDSVLIQSGSGANEVLRGLVQGLEDVVDAVGKVPAPVLGAVAGVAALAGGALLLGGTLISVIPKIAATKVALETLAPAGSKAAGVFSAISKAALPAAAALTGVLIVKKIAEDMLPAAKSTQDMTTALIALGTGAKSVNEALDKSVFARANNGLFGLTGVTEQIDTAGAAIARLNDLSFSDNLNDFMNGFIDLGGKLPELRKSLEGVDTAMADLTTNGNADLAAKSFKKIAEEAEKKGVSLETTAKSFPQYLDGLKKLASDSKVALTEQELLDWAMGKIPAKMEAAAKTTEGQAKAAEVAAKASEDFAKALEEIGLAADGSVTNIDKFTQALFNAGLIHLSASAASIAYQAAIDDLSASVMKNGTTLDINTEQGRANRAAFDGLATAAMNAATATATETLATQGADAAMASLQGSLRTSYDDLVRAAGQFGITGDEADTMARKALGIPKEVPIDTWVNDNASAKLDAIKGKRDALDGTSATVSIYERTIRSIEERSVAPDLNGAGSGGGRPGLWMGGRVGDVMPGAFSGKVPGRAPANRRIDNVLATVNGKPLAVQSEEWIINGRSSKEYDRELAAINAGTFPKMPGYANGGQVREFSAQQLGYAPYRSEGSRGGGATFGDVHISQQSDPVATFHEFARRTEALAT